MPGKTPAEAIQAYISPLQQSLSCFGKTLIRSNGYGPGVLHAATLSEPTVQVVTQEEEILNLSFIQQFEVRKTLLGLWKVTTRSYLYSVEDEAGQEIIAFHWHPDSGDSPIHFPHMHICHGAGVSIRPEVRNIHFRTDRIAFEDFALILIDDFHVVPDRDDARAVLEANLGKFKAHRSWSSVF